MWSPATLLAALRVEGFTLTRVGAGTRETLRVAPAERLTSSWRVAIRGHREGLLALLPPSTVGAGGSTPQMTLSRASGGSHSPIVATDVGDPRPDLAGDSAAWRFVLRCAFAIDGDAADGLYGALHGVRCCGARLELREQRPGGWRIVPGVAYLGGPSAWEKDRADWLLPRRGSVAQLLLGLPGLGEKRAVRTTSEPAIREAARRACGTHRGMETRLSKGRPAEPCKELDDARSA